MGPKDQVPKKLNNMGCNPAFGLVVTPRESQLNAHGFECRRFDQWQGLFDESTEDYIAPKVYEDLVAKPGTPMFVEWQGGGQTMSYAFVIPMKETRDGVEAVMDNMA